MGKEVDWREALLEAGRETGIDTLVELVLDALAQELPVLVEDPDLRSVARSSTAANLALIVELTRQSVTLSELQSPPQASAFTRELARRNVPVASLVRAYRVAEIAMWQWAVGEVRRRVPQDRLADAIESVSHATYTTGEAFGILVTERYALERERWMRSADAVRAVTVRDLVAGEPVDPAAASSRLRYELRQNHQAFVVWVEGTEAVPESAAAGVGGPRALLVPMGVGVVAGWSPAESVDPSAAAGNAHVALGSAGQGIEGFRTSHLEAMEARRVARLTGTGGKPVRYRDVALLAVLTKDLDQARSFAEHTLGPLVDDDEPVRRLADTVLVVLEEQGSPRRAARRLGIHENTVAKRLRAVFELLGEDPSERPAEFLAALQILRAVRSQDANAHPVAHE